MIVHWVFEHNNSTYYSAVALFILLANGLCGKIHGDQLYKLHHLGVFDMYLPRLDMQLTKNSNLFM